MTEIEDVEINNRIISAILIIAKGQFSLLSD